MPLLETQDNGAGQILVDCPLKRDKGDPGYLILVKGECDKCLHHKGILEKNEAGIDISAQPLLENVVADEIYPKKRFVTCGYEKGDEHGRTA